MRKTVTATLLGGLIFVGREPGIREVEASSGSTADSPGVVLEWNQLLQATIPSNASLPAPRFYAMMHIAMFGAANSVEREYTRYRVRLRHGSSVSAELSGVAPATIPRSGGRLAL